MGRDEVDQCWRCKEDWERERNCYIFARNMREKEIERHKRIAQWLAEMLENFAVCAEHHDAAGWLQRAKEATEPESGVVMSSEG